MHEPAQHAVPFATAVGGAVLALAPHSIDWFDAIYRFAGLIAVVSGLAISMIRLVWDHQERRELRMDRQWARANREHLDRRSPLPKRVLP